MYCPECESKTKVIETDVRAHTVRRRRACPACKHRFTTQEQLRVEHPLVRLGHGKRVPYHRALVRPDLQAACENSHLMQAEIEVLLDAIEAALLGQTVVTLTDLQQAIARQLFQLDAPASVVYIVRTQRPVSLQALKDALGRARL